MHPAQDIKKTPFVPYHANDEQGAQRAAREIILAIPLFPDLTVALRAALGYGPHVDMLQHFCYWMHPRHPKMQNRWTMYKTYAEWENECGLVRRQVDRGRKKLRAHRLVSEKLGQYKRLHYRVDWVALASILNLYTKGEQIDDLDDDFNLYAEGEQIQSVHQGEHVNLYTKGVQSNTGEYAGHYNRKSSLQESGDGSERRTAARDKDKEEANTEGDDTLSDFDTALTSGAGQREKPAKGEVEGETPPDKAAESAVVADAARVAEARSALNALFGEWPGYIDDIHAGKWDELGMTVKQLRFAEQRFTAPEMMLAAQRLATGEAAEPERAAAYG